MWRSASIATSACTGPPPCISKSFRRTFRWPRTVAPSRPNGWTCDQALVEAARRPTRRKHLVEAAGAGHRGIDLGPGRFGAGVVHLRDGEAGVQESAERYGDQLGTRGHRGARATRPFGRVAR